MRYLFLCPDTTKASGGVAVIYNVVGALRRAGHDAFLLHNSPDAGHPDYITDIPIFYTLRVRKAEMATTSIRGMANRTVEIARDSIAGSGQLQKLSLAKDDVVVVPEFMMAPALAAFPDNRIVIFAQNPFAFLRAYDEAQSQGLSPKDRVSWFLGISEINRSAYDLLGIENASYFKVNPELQLFGFAEQKEKLITYMPRKRPKEAALIDAALRRRGNLRGYALQSVDGVSRAEVAAILARSRFFISLLDKEALGFPAAEAMAAGCVVVGYDGLGTREYFDETTGIVVAEGDTFGIVRAVEEALEEYDTAPERLDEMRKRGSDLIHATYNRDVFERELLTTWSALAAHLST